MNTEKLYRLLESAHKDDGFNLNGVWDRMTYTAKMLLCERMVDNGTWEQLPDHVLWLEQEVI